MGSIVFLCPGLTDYRRGFECVNQWQAHSGVVLSSTIGGKRLITGGNDCYLAIWDISACVPSESKEETGTPTLGLAYTDILFRALSKLVSLKTISGSSTYTEECRRGATFLKNLLKQLGAADTTLLPNPFPGRNPVVLGKFRSKSSQAKTLLFYGHYDIVTAATGSSAWTDDAYSMSGRDGFYYGRGVSDNKGPVLAAMFAASDLLKQGVDVNVTFLIEGEEECGSKGFAESVMTKKVIAVLMRLIAGYHWAGGLDFLEQQLLA
jgi:di- and tripeptidase